MKEEVYRGTSLTKKKTRPGPYRRPVPRVLGESKGGGSPLWARYSCMPLYAHQHRCGVQGAGFRVQGSGFGASNRVRAHTHTHTHTY